MAKKVLTWTGLAMSLLGAACAVVLYAPWAVGLTAYEIRTGSMMPAMAPGDVAYVRHGPPAEGDVAAFTDRDGVVVIHRVIRVTDAGVVTKGDANRDADGYVARPADIIGTVAFRAPGGCVVSALCAATLLAMLCGGLSLTAAGLSIRKGGPAT